MPAIKDIDNFINNILHSETIKDIAINGIQVENNSEIKKTAFGVDISTELINNAIKTDSNLIIVHHGLFWGNLYPITGTLKERLKLLLENNIGLIAYHLPLDMHEEIGNNAQILKKISNNKLTPFGFDKGYYYGYQTEQDHPLTIDEIKEKILVQESIYLNFGKEKIKKIAVVSGSAAKFVTQAKENNADLFITGETDHSSYHIAKELAINVLFIGHYYSETFGVKALMKTLEKEFKLECNFFDIPTGF